MLSLAIIGLTIKLGALSPEGSSYMVLANKFKEEFEKLTGIKVVWYAGGVMGDEPEMVRKIKFGQLNGGGFTGYGLSIIEGSVRIFEIPGVFKTYDEFFYVWEKFKDEIRAKFEEKGFELIVYFPIGFVYIFSQKPITKLDDFKGVKLWVWSGDPLAGEVAQSLRGYAQLINLSIADVLTGLQTGMINSFYNLPYGAVALQWTNHIKYMLDLPISLATGGIVISKKVINEMKPEQKKIFYELMQKYFNEASKSLLGENENALKEIQKKGIKIIKIPEDSEDIKKFRQEVFKKVHEKFKGELYSQELYDIFIKEVEKYRNEKAKGG